MCATILIFLCLHLNFQTGSHWIVQTHCVSWNGLQLMILLLQLSEYPEPQAIRLVQNIVLHFKFWSGPQLSPALGIVAVSLGGNSGNLPLADQQYCEVIPLFPALLGPGASELVITHPICQWLSVHSHLDSLLYPSSLGIKYWSPGPRRLHFEAAEFRWINPHRWLLVWFIIFICACWLGIRHCLLSAPLVLVWNWKGIDFWGLREEILSLPAATPTKGTDWPGDFEVHLAPFEAGEVWGSANTQYLLHMTNILPWVLLVGRREKYTIVNF